jgi:hypothetical protein
MINPSASAGAAKVLVQAAKAYGKKRGDRPAAKAVVEALLQAEKAAKQQRLTYPFEALDGQWRLCFTTGTRKAKRGGIVAGKGFYLPKLTPAFISFAAASESETNEAEAKAQGTIGNQIQLAGVQLCLTGVCRYEGKKNLLAFDFTQMQIFAFNRSLYTGSIRGGKAQAEQFDQQPLSKLPFFSFFLVTDALIAARGRGGGLALWIRAS